MSAEISISEGKNLSLKATHSTFGMWLSLVNEVKSAKKDHCTDIYRNGGRGWEAIVEDVIVRGIEAHW